ncbi:hypothetical protein CCACVL1_06189, partial [Corchorus capsularis]
IRQTWEKEKPWKQNWQAWSLIASSKKMTWTGEICIGRSPGESSVSTNIGRWCRLWVNLLLPSCCRLWDKRRYG